MTKIAVVISLLAAFIFLKNRFSLYPEDSETGIRFFKGTWQEALQKAAAEDKPVFLDIYASWCGPCKKLKRVTFADAEAGKFFNDHFINVELDGEQPEGNMLAKTYGVRGYPALFVVDRNGKVKAYSAGYLSARELIEFGNSALN